MLIISNPKLNKLNLFAPIVSLNFKMKKYIFYLLFLPLLFACSKDENRRNENPFLPDYSFTVDLNLNLPLYSNLNSPFSPQLVNLQGAGIKGLIIMKISDTDYRVWEAACPNQYPSETCSLMEIIGIKSKCPCDDLEYNLTDGVGNGPYTLKPYRVEVSGKILHIYN